jgi:endonuclease/exonuclease/phosphatase family metal-dependent hydrolase
MKRSLWISTLLLAIVCLFFLAGCDLFKLPGVTQYSFRSEDLEKYTIIYEEGNPDYFDLANKLSDRIAEKYGITLQIKPDVVAAPSKYEILLGDTNRYDQQSKVMEYSVTVKDGRFRINVGGSFSADKAVDFLCKNIFNGKELNLANGEYYRKSLLTKAYPLAENTTARIMTANILADAFADNSYNKASYRAEIFAGMLIAYTPDVIGLQEVDESWNQAIDDYLARLQSAHGITYSRHLATYEGKVNYTSLLYRSDKFKVEDSGVNLFTWWTDRSFNHNYHMRNISWAQFSSLADAGKKFIVANTHWSYRTEHADGKTYLSNSATPIAANELREQCKNETNNFMSKLKQTYSGMPIFLTGDFNTSLSLFTQSGWTPTAFRIISEEAKTNGTSLSTVPVSGHYDHLFGTGNYTVRHYAFFTDTDYHNLLTDHPFAYADLAF